jgi:hypothetical protein
LRTVMSCAVYERCDLLAAAVDALAEVDLLR